MIDKRIKNALASVPVQNGQYLKGEHMAILRDVLSSAINRNKNDIDMLISGDPEALVFYSTFDRAGVLVNTAKDNLEMYAPDGGIVDGTVAYLMEYGDESEYGIHKYEYVEDTWTKIRTFSFDNMYDILDAFGIDLNVLKDKVENYTIQEANDTDTIDVVLINDSPYGRIIEANLKINESKNDFIKNDDNGKGIYVSTVDIQESIDDAIKSNGTEINESIKGLISGLALRVDGTNKMEADIDLDGNQIKNVADAVVDDDAINLGQLKAYVTVEDTTW